MHWARDGAEANAIVASIVRAHGTDEVIKVKSLATDEIGINEALEAAGHPRDRDRPRGADRPARPRRQAVAHPRARRSIATGPRSGRCSSARSPRASRSGNEATRDRRGRAAAPALEVPDRAGRGLGRELRDRRDRHDRRRRVRGQRAHVPDAAEGAGDVDGDREAAARVARPRGVPAAAAALVDRRAHEPVHVAVDRRAAGDGPQEFHLVLLDGGRTYVLADEVGRQALHCIRCSACLNVCPVYERVGGQAYESVYPGPIGAILTPQLRGLGPGAVAAVGVVAVRRLLRGLPGQDRHPVACSCTCAGASCARRSPSSTPEALAMKGMAAAFALAPPLRGRAAPGAARPRAAGEGRAARAGPRCATSRSRPRRPSATGGSTAAAPGPRGLGRMASAAPPSGA